MPPIKNIVFDCDNTLVMSEELAFDGCAHLLNEIFPQYGIDKKYNGAELQTEFVGTGFRGQITALMKKHNFTIPPETLEKYIARELDAICASLDKDCEPCAGAPAVIQRLSEQGKYGLAIASSSATPRVNAGITKGGMKPFFPANRVFSAADSLDPPSSKPDPKIYQHACEQLGAKPAECLAVEDSRSGSIAAVRAGMPLMAYVGPYEFEGGRAKQEEMAKMLTEIGAINVMWHWDEFEEKLKEIEAK